jgi:hypothetical protein
MATAVGFPGSLAHELASPNGFKILLDPWLEENLVRSAWN